MRRLFHKLHVLFDLLGDGDQGVGEQIELPLLSVSVGSIIMRPGHDQREADRLRMESVVDQPLGDVAGMDAGASGGGR